MIYVMFLLSELAVLVLPKITFFKKHADSNLQSLPIIDHRLNQSEIDDLVNNLLSKRNKSYPLRQSLKG